VGTAVAPTFYQNTLRAGYVSDSSGKLSALGVPGSILAGINVNFAQGPDTYNVDSADVLSTSGGSLAAMTYDNTTTTLDGLNAIGLWQAPSFSGTTTADDSTFGIVTTPTLEGSGSGRLNYNWALGTLIRERAANPNASLPTFNADSDFGIWVYGDNSGNQFRISFRDPVDGELYAKPYTTIDWTGWKLHMIPDVKNNLGTVWAAGVNNVLNGPTVQLESILMQKGASSPASGNIYFDLITVRSLTASSQTAAVQYSGTYKAVTFGFPFEAIGSQSERNQVMGAVMNFFGAPSHVADWQLY